MVSGSGAGKSYFRTVKNWGQGQRCLTPFRRTHQKEGGPSRAPPGRRRSAVIGRGTKGNDNRAGIVGEERFKTDSAKKFFEVSKAEGGPVEFVTKINGGKLGRLVASIVDGKPVRASSGLNDVSDQSV